MQQGCALGTGQALLGWRVVPPELDFSSFTLFFHHSEDLVLPGSLQDDEEETRWFWWQGSPVTCSWTFPKSALTQEDHDVGLRAICSQKKLSQPWESP